MQGAVLIVDDNAELGGFLERLLVGEGYDTALAGNADKAREAMAKLHPDAVLMDIKLPDANGVELMAELKKKYPETQFIMMTAFASVRTAIKSMKTGAFDYLAKPFDPGEMINLLGNALKGRALKEEVSRLRSMRAPRAKAGRDYPSAAMKRTMETCAKLAAGKGNVLLTGESGAGKNHLAGLIHGMSPRSRGPFFDINCAALAPSLIESELFGHEPGAFTGAEGRRRGLIELAHEGTLFLDEIGDMPLALQAKLLSFLDTHKLRRVGGEKVIEVDVRVLAATNRDLKDAISRGNFREDLFYRLNVVSLEVPPLRKRIEDIPALLDEILASLAAEMGLPGPPAFGPAAVEKLMSHDWPGNVRELRNAVERAVMLAPDKTEIPDIALDTEPAKAPGAEGRPAADPGPKGSRAFFEVEFPAEGVDLKEATRGVSRALIVEALKRADTKKEAAALLGITRDSLAHHIKTLGIDA